MFSRWLSTVALLLAAELHELYHISSGLYEAPRDSAASTHTLVTSAAAEDTMLPISSSDVPAFPFRNGELSSLLLLIPAMAAASCVSERAACIWAVWSRFSSFLFSFHGLKKLVKDLALGHIFGCWKSICSTSYCNFRCRWAPRSTEELQSMDRALWDLHLIDYRYHCLGSYKIIRTTIWIENEEVNHPIISTLHVHYVDLNFLKINASLVGRVDSQVGRVHVTPGDEKLPPLLPLAPQPGGL